MFSNKQLHMYRKSIINVWKQLFTSNKSSCPTVLVILKKICETGQWLKGLNHKQQQNCQARKSARLISIVVGVMKVVVSRLCFACRCFSQTSKPWTDWTTQAIKVSFFTLKSISSLFYIIQQKMQINTVMFLLNEFEDKATKCSMVFGLGLTAASYSNQVT